MADKTEDVLAVLEGMRRLTHIGRCMDGNYPSEALIRESKKEIAAVAAIAELLAAAEDYRRLVRVRNQLETTAHAFPGSVAIKEQSLSSDTDKAFARLSVAILAMRGEPPVG